MVKKKEIIKNASFFYDEMKLQATEAISNSLTKETMRLTGNGKKYYLFPLVEQHGFNTWESLANEYLLIAAKKSILSATVRVAIDSIVFHVNHRLETYENLQTVKKLTSTQVKASKQVKTKQVKTKLMIDRDLGKH